jgi:hypothetical protein
MWDFFGLFKTKKKEVSPVFADLKTRLEQRHESTQDKLWQKHQDALHWVNRNITPKQLAAGSIGGLMLLQAPAVVALPTPPLALAEQHQKAPNVDPKGEVILDLKQKLPDIVRPLTPDEENDIAAMLSKDYGIPVAPVLEGKRLNTTYGVIGGEQHLYRYPGDTLDQQFDTQEERDMFESSGMAPGKGAWGYFASSKASFTEKDKQREKYYLAVQTFLSRDYNTRVSEYRDFFKFRKMLVVNPNTGQAVVAVIGDAGPAVWTGKHLGGSPEVMHEVGLAKGMRKGAVLYFFVDDPNDTIPLGPVTVKTT